MKFKKWVVNTLIIVNMLLVYSTSFEMEDMTLFIASKAAALLLIVFNHLLLVNYSDLFKEEI